MIKNKRVLIVGGASGIGLSIARECHESGAQVIISSRNEAKLQSSQSIIGDNCTSIKCDVTSSKSIIELFYKVGNIDHLVVTVGKPLAKKFMELSENDARRDFDLNFWSKFNLAQKSMNNLSERGSILFISGAFAKKPNSNLFITSISVAAIESLTRTLALTIGPKRVNAIAPYVIDASDLTNESVDEERKSFLIKTTESLPGKYVGQGEDIGKAAVFLLSSPYSTGAILRLDGGYTIA